MTKYNKYKSSSIDWIEEIPEHWKDIDVRKAFVKNEVKNNTLQEQNLLTLSYGSIKRKNINTANGLLPASFDNYQILQKGMIVLRMLDLQNDKNSLRVGYVKEQGIITSAYIGLDSKIDNNTKYFYYLLHFMDLIKHFYNGGGGVRQSIGYTDFRRELIILPPKPEQTAIANFLDYKLEKIDRFITKKKQLIELLNEQKAAIINQAVTKGVPPNDELSIMNDELKDENSQFKTHNSKFKKSGIEWLGDIPESWEVRKLKTIVKNSCLGGNYNSSEADTGIPLMKMGNLGRGKIKLNKIEYINPKEEYEEKHILKQKDFLFNTRNSADLVGKVSLWQNQLPFSLYNSNILKIEFKKGFMNEYLNCLFNSKALLGILRLTSKGTTNVSAIYYKDLSLIKIWIPKNVEEQKAIVQHIETETVKIAKTITTIQKEIALVEEYKTALIAEAVTGKIDVRNYKV